MVLILCDLHCNRVLILDTTESSFSLALLYIVYRPTFKKTNVSVYLCYKHPYLNQQHTIETQHVYGDSTGMVVQTRAKVYVTLVINGVAVKRLQHAAFKTVL